MAPDSSAAPLPLAQAGLCVSAGHDIVRFPLRSVLEILRPLPLTRVPHAPSALLGLANLRGQVLPVASLAVLLGGVATTGAAARVVVIARGGQRIGLLVDAVLPGRVEEARTVDPAALLPASFAPGGAPEREAARSEPEPAGSRGAEPSPAERRVALLLFRIGGQDFALPLSAVDAVTTLADDGPAAPQPVPDCDAAMLGVIAWRRLPLPVLSGAVLLGRARRTTTRLVVLRTGGHLCGLAVEDVSGILHVDPAAIDAVPPLLQRGQGAEARVAGLYRLENGARLVQLLDQNRLLRDSTAVLPRIGVEAAAPEPAEAVERVLLVRLGGERYGLPLSCVREVVRHPGRLTRLPNAPGFVDGVITLRGRVLPVIDQAMRLGAGPGQDQERRIVVVMANTVPVGIAVEATLSLAGFPAGTLSPAPGFGAEGSFDRVATPGGHGNDAPVLLLDPAALLCGVAADLAAALRGAGA